MRKVALALFLFILFVALATDATSGISIGNNDIAISTSPKSLIVGLLLNSIFLVCAFGLARCAIDDFGRVGIFRRITAFSIDTIFFVIAIIPFSSLVFICSEYLVSGTFEWATNISPASVLELRIANGVIWLSVILFLLYYYFTLLLSISTLGQFIVGYVVTTKKGDDVTPVKVILRLLLSLIAMSVWPITLLVVMLKPQDHQLWYERNSSFVARKITC